VLSLVLRVEGEEPDCRIVSARLIIEEEETE
jgi:hypothetical protein